MASVADALISRIPFMLAVIPVVPAGTGGRLAPGGPEMALGTVRGQVVAGAAI